MRGRKPHKVILKLEQLKIINIHLKTGKTEQRLARRARILLLSHEGKYPGEIAEYVDCDPATVWRTRKRFGERGLEALHDRPRPGAPRRISPPPKSSDTGSRVLAAKQARSRSHALVHA